MTSNEYGTNTLGFLFELLMIMSIGNPKGMMTCTHGKSISTHEAKRFMYCVFFLPRAVGELGLHISATIKDILPCSDLDIAKELSGNALGISHILQRLGAIRIHTLLQFSKNYQKLNRERKTGSQVSNLSTRSFSDLFLPNANFPCVLGRTT